ncbi:MAG: isoprenylcysteine carboxylmethyltransferase family protein, partial [Chloroflexi bacterium]
RREERDAQTEFGEAYTRYKAITPAFFPKFGGGKAITESR